MEDNVTLVAGASKHHYFCYEDGEHVVPWHIVWFWWCVQVKLLAIKTCRDCRITYSYLTAFSPPSPP